MNNKSIQLRLALLCIAGAMSATAVARGIDPDTVKSASTDLVFGANAELTHTLSSVVAPGQKFDPRQYNSDFVFANGEISFPHFTGATHEYVVRFSENTGTPGEAPSQVTIQGDSQKAENVLKLRLMGEHGSSSLSPIDDRWLQLVKIDGWSTGTDLAKYTVVADGSQYVYPDNYKVSVDAAIYHP
jgi:hypothetical protein